MKTIIYVSKSFRAATRALETQYAGYQQVSVINRKSDERKFSVPTIGAFIATPENRLIEILSSIKEDVKVVYVEPEPLENLQDRVRALEEKNRDQEWNLEVIKMQDSLERTIKVIAESIAKTVVEDAVKRNAELNDDLSKLTTDKYSLLRTTSSSFAAKILQIARDTGQSFKDACQAAEIFCQQGLSGDEVLIRLKSALILSRLSGLGSAQSVETLISAVNAFKGALSTEYILNKMIQTDAKFVISTKELTEAIARVGSTKNDAGPNCDLSKLINSTKDLTDALYPVLLTATDAGVSFENLTHLIRNAQKVTGRGGAVVGNSLKTIFTRLQREDVLKELHWMGVKVQGAGTMEILKGLAIEFDSLSEKDQSKVVELIGGAFQANQLKAILSSIK